MKTGTVLIVSGPSGVGKSTVLNAVFQRRENLVFSVSATTRPPREGERDGVDYHFLSVDTFREWIDRDEFLEYAEYVGNYYGTPRQYVTEATAAGKDVVLDIETQGAEQVRRKLPDAVSVFIAPPGWEELERRLVSRGTDSPEKIQKRLLRAREEVRSARDYNYFVINDNLETAVGELDAILTAEHCKSRERIEKLCQ